MMSRNACFRHVQKKAVFFLSCVLLVYSVSALEFFSGRMNFPEKEARNHTQVITYSGTNLSVTIPENFTLVSFSSGGLVSGSVLSFGNGTDKTVNYTLQSPSACSVGTRFFSNISVNNTFSNRFVFVCVNDSLIVDHKLEYGHGDANYLSENVISNERATLFNLVRVFTLGQYLDVHEPAKNASINCFFENFPIRTFGRVVVSHVDGLIRANFSWDEIESGYWFRIGVLSQDVSGKTAGDSYIINCSDVQYDFVHQRVLAGFANKTVVIRGVFPFNVTIVPQDDRLTYTIKNVEQYSVKELVFQWRINSSASREVIQSLFPNDSVVFDVFAQGSGMINLTVDFVPSWFANSRNPQVYRQSNVSLFNISGDVSRITNLNQVILKTINATVANTSLSQKASFRVLVSDFDEVTANRLYRTVFWVFDGEGKPKDADSNPKISIFNPARSVIVQNATMGRIGTGIYNFSFNVTSGNIAGVWEAVVTAVVGNSSVEQSDFWELEGSPARVSVDDCVNTVIPNLTAAVTIQNEGSSEQEYQIRFCAVETDENECGGDDDLAFGQQAKLLSANETFESQLVLGGLSKSGAVFFRVDVFFGTEKSSAVKTCVLTLPEEVEAAAGGVPSRTAPGLRNVTKNAVDGQFSSFFRKAVKKEQEILVRGKKGFVEIVNAPEFLVLVKNRSLSKTILIVNEGDAVLTNVQFIIEGLPRDSYTIIPESYSVFGAGEVLIFHVAFAPNINPGTYSIKYWVITDQGSVQKEGTFFVLEHEEDVFSKRVLNAVREVIVPLLAGIILIFLIFRFLFKEKKKFKN